MKHASRETLRGLNTLLKSIRKFSKLKERSLGIFYFKSNAFLHFHEDSSGSYADLKHGKAWKRFRVNSSVERKALMVAISEQLK